jgi:cytochrome c-type biogenesis protein
MALIADIITSFLLGLATPLTAVCVLPLYPAFLAYLANNSLGKDEEEQKRGYAGFGFIITLGVISFMLLFGLLFTTLLQHSLTNAVGIISPIAFGILAIISIFMIFDWDIGKFIPKTKVQNSEGSSKKKGFFYGFFFGAIVLPCNPGFIAAFLARSLLMDNFISSMGNFLAFGLGLGFPLLAFSLISANYSRNIIGFLTRHKTGINRLAGVAMLIIALYYLFFVFKIQNLIFLIG